MGRHRRMAALAAAWLAATPGAAWAGWVVNGTDYTTFADAQDAASTGDTITLDETLTDTLVIEKDLTIQGIDDDAILRSSSLSAITIAANRTVVIQNIRVCLLYTSDAADE